MSDASSKVNPPKANLLDLSPTALVAWCEGIGEQRFRARQLMKWLYHEGHEHFAEMTNLSKALREKLADLAEVRVPEIIEEKISADGTRKWLLKMDCGNAVETVFIPDGRRGTLCVSSQVGCALNCSFCSTATQGFNRNLSTAEIIGQFWVAHRSFGYPPKHQRVITNVVFMGMGEPLLNFDNAIAAAELMMDDFCYGLGKRRVTVSTAGVAPLFDRLKEATDVSLAVSLHAPFDELRNVLVPLNKKYPLEELIAACKRFAEGYHRRHITFEYVMLDGVNDGDIHARALVKLLADVPAKFNLIPFNPFPGARYKRSPQERILRFRDILSGHGFNCITRKTRGDDIDAACGQLVGHFRDRTSRRERMAKQSVASPGG